MHKIGIVGDYESTKGFAAVGLSTFSVRDAKEASDVLKKLILDEYAIIYMIDDLFVSLKDEIKKISELTLPIIIPVPGIRGILAGGKNSIGMDNLREMAIRAIGSDIVFDKD